MGRAWYNEIDPYAAQWLRNLIAAGEIAPGDVDERDIRDVRADELRGYGQCHFFAGIGGWSVALRLAGWPDDRSVWTGSCPCQPFSAAGKGAAADDERHLWPAWASLIAECCPGTVFGEQVEAAIGWGWLDAVFADLEAQGYACGATVLPACGVGAPHIRNRLWFVADANEFRTEPRVGEPGRTGSEERQGPVGRGIPRGLADAVLTGRAEGRPRSGDGSAPGSGGAGLVGLPAGAGLPQRERVSREARGADGTGARQAAERGGRDLPFWADVQWLPCTDGKARPVEPGSFPLAHGVQRRPSKLRAYGNAIVPQVAAEFVRAVG